MNAIAPNADDNTAYLGFTGKPSRAASLDIPLAELYGTEAPTHASIALEIDYDKPEKCRAYLQRIDALSNLSIMAISVAFPTTMLLDLHNQIPDPTPPIIGDTFEDEPEEVLSPQAREEADLNHFERLIRIGTDALEELYTARAAANQMGKSDEFEKALDAAVDKRITRRSEEMAAREVEPPLTF